RARQRCRLQGVAPILVDRLADRRLDAVGRVEADVPLVETERILDAVHHVADADDAGERDGIEQLAHGQIIPTTNSSTPNSQLLNSQVPTPQLPTPKEHPTLNSQNPNTKGSWKRETGNGKPATGNGQRATGNDAFTPARGCVAAWRRRG